MSEYPSYLIHYGTLGQKWGVRRYQNEDGSLTSEGREHYGYGSKRDNEKLYKKLSKVGKNAKVYPNGGYSSKISLKDYKKLAKNKAVQEAISDEKLTKSYNKWRTTDSKLYEPDWDNELWKVQKKLKKDWNTMSDSEKDEVFKKVDTNYDKAVKKYNELYKKDPQTLAYNDFSKERDRVVKNLVGENANKKIGDITYDKHARYVIDYALLFKFDEIENMLSKKK